MKTPTCCGHPMEWDSDPLAADKDGQPIACWSCHRCDATSSDPARAWFERLLANGWSAREAAEKLVRQRVPGAKALARVFVEPFGKVKR